MVKLFHKNKDCDEGGTVEGLPESRRMVRADSVIYRLPITSELEIRAFVPGSSVARVKG